MSTAATSIRKLLPTLDLSSEKGHEIVGLILAATVALLAGSLFSYHPLDPSILHRVAEENASTRNLVGPFGAHLAALCFSFFGLTCLLLPPLLGVVAWRRWQGREAGPRLPRALGLLAVVPAVPGLAALLLGEVSWRGVPVAAGGVIGLVVAETLSAWLHAGGALVVLVAALLVGGNLTVRSTLKDLLKVARTHLGSLAERGRLIWARRRKRHHEQSTHRRVVRQLRDSHQESAAAATPPKIDLPLHGPRHRDRPAAAVPAGDRRPLRVREKKGAGHFAFRRLGPGEVPPAAGDPAAGDPAAGDPAAGDPAADEASRRPASRPASRRPASRRPAGDKKAGRGRKAPGQQKTLGFRPEEMAPVELPPVNLLRTDRPLKDHDEKELLERAEVIRQAFEHFGIEGTIEGISPGPVITVYELQPAPGIKVSRIVNLQDDLALALKAESVRIERLPGRSTLGIEVPNKIRHLIRLGELMAHEKFRRAPSVLTMALGVDIYGRPYYADLASMPHLLVAGATGSGKSVGLQSMITSILYKAGRDQVQFIFIDPKRIELGVYAKIPHLKTEVVMDPKKAANGLRWAVAEMERRYRLLAEVHVRSIDQYNHAIRDPEARRRLSLREGESELENEDWKSLPYYVIVIDELADLMIVASSEVETSIARLAQMARAVGIHLIVATQRPSVDVLTGTIKANFPCRLSYATATRHDSRTILDGVGAEKLLGKGDALFVPPGTSRILRLHGAYVTEQETAGLVRWLKKRGKPDLDLDILKDPEGGKGGGGGGDSDGDDELFDEAARLVVRERQASASFLQRRLRIGFARASRLIDIMAGDGLLGPAQGSKPREILVEADYFEEIERAREGVED